MRCQGAARSDQWNSCFLKYSSGIYGGRKRRTGSNSWASGTEDPFRSLGGVVVGRPGRSPVPTGVQQHGEALAARGAPDASPHQAQPERGEGGPLGQPGGAEGPRAELGDRLP